MHAEIILAQSIEDYSPLFAELADAYFERSMFAHARPVYEMLGAEAAVSSLLSLHMPVLDTSLDQQYTRTYAHRGLSTCPGGL